MRDCTGGTILDPAFSILKIAAAALSECIQRAVAEQTVETFRICCFMAGENLTFPVTEVFVMFHLFPAFCHHFGQSGFFGWIKTLNDVILT